MPGRFKVRPMGDEPGRSGDGFPAAPLPHAAGQGSGKFGVWDNAVNGWRATNLTDENEAHRVASDLEIQYDARGPRQPETVEWVKPAPLLVDQVTWQPAGVLDVWIRDNGQWFGRVRDESGRVRWIAGSDLRRAQ